ncbi:hypothetical protein RP20_CCG025455 [Aedes albopictus]|nr:hypothetical protein RP20_CCG025455 [Aedes albopictus]
MSNGYSSPMSTGSYDPYSPNGKMETTHSLAIIMVTATDGDDDGYFQDQCWLVLRISQQQPKPPQG